MIGRSRQESSDRCNTEGRHKSPTGTKSQSCENWLGRCHLRRGTDGWGETSGETSVGSLGRKAAAGFGAGMAGQHRRDMSEMVCYVKCPADKGQVKRRGRMSGSHLRYPEGGLVQSRQHSRKSGGSSSGPRDNRARKGSTPAGGIGVLSLAGNVTNRLKSDGTFPVREGSCGQYFL